MSFSIGPNDLSQTLAIGDGAMVALVGGGGKTTTMLALAAGLAAAHNVLVTTTTKIWPIQGTTTIFAGAETEAWEQVRVGPGARSPAVLAASLGSDGKLHGVAPEMLTALAGGSEGIILCEADGAAGRPLKVHGPGEPVIPAGASHVLAIAGLDCLGRTAGPDTVHRAGRYQEVTGGVLGRPIEPVHVARALTAAANFAPSGASRFFLLNKRDSSGGDAAAVLVASALRNLQPASRILVTHRGDLVNDLS